jgi:hypothetical protein
MRRASSLRMRPRQDTGRWPLRGQNHHPTYPPSHPQELLKETSAATPPSKATGRDLAITPPGREPPGAMRAAGSLCRQVPADAAASQLGKASPSVLPLLPGDGAQPPLTRAVCTPTKGPGDGVGENVHFSRPTRAATDGPAQSQSGLPYRSIHRLRSRKASCPTRLEARSPAPTRR